MSFENPPQKIKPHYGHSFEISRFEEGDSIPVGGESKFSTEANIKINGDFEKFEKFFGEIEEVAGKYDLNKLKEWLASHGLEVDEKMFANLLAFTKKFEIQYPTNPQAGETRRKLYAEKGEGLKLSDIFEANSPECAEIAALAQGYLQREDIPSSYFSGDVLWDRDQEFSEEHSFIVIRLGDKIYLYDPMNPTDTTQGKFPSLYTTKANFDEEMAEGEKRFVAAKNILSKKDAFYGVNDGTNIYPERHITG